MNPLGPLQHEHHHLFFERTSGLPLGYFDDGRRLRRWKVLAMPLALLALLALAVVTRY